mgnify:CR=1 FL=1
MALYRAYYEAVKSGLILSAHDVSEGGLAVALGQALEQSGADGLMIGRGAYGKPWLLGQVMHWWRTGEARAAPGIDEQYALVVEHYNRMLDHYGRDTGVKMARKHLGWYTKGLHGSAEFRNMANFIDDADQVLGEIERFYTPFLMQQAA